MYSIVTQHLCILYSDHHGKSSTHVTPRKLLFTMFSVLYFSSLQLIDSISGNLHLLFPFTILPLFSLYFTYSLLFIFYFNNTDNYRLITNSSDSALSFQNHENKIENNVVSRKSFFLWDESLTLILLL